MLSADIDGLCTYHGKSAGGFCGYCSSSKEAHGEMRSLCAATLHQVKPSFYEKLIKKNWMRCGNYFYQPLNFKTCCPQYANRVNIHHFKMTAKHGRVLRKVEHWLKTGERNLPKNEPKRRLKRGRMRKSYYPTLDKIILESILKLVETKTIFSTLSKGEIIEIPIFTQINRKMRGVGHKKFQFCTSVVFQLIGLMKKKRKTNENDQKRDKKLDGFEYAEILAETINDCIRTLSDEDLKNTQVEAFRNGYLHISVTKEKYQHLLNQYQQPKEEEEENEGEVDDEEREEKEKDRKILKDELIEEEIITELKPSQFVEEEYELYKKYQIEVHKDKPMDDKLSQSSYFGYNCESSLILESSDNNNKLPLKGYGSFHYTYRLKKSRKLIAVSCLDIIPGGVISDYFFYDPDYSFLEIGKYSILHEIRTLLPKNGDDFHPEFKYYYFGYYVHDCSKMNYKGKYKPQQILCNVTWKWCELDTAIKEVLDHRKCGRFYTETQIDKMKNEEEGEEEEEETKTNDNRDTLIYYDGQLVRKEIFGALFGELREVTLQKMEEFHDVLGELAENLAYRCYQKDLVPTYSYDQFGGSSGVWEHQ